MDTACDAVILFPSDHLNQSKPTMLFEKEYELALANPYVKARLYDIDSFFEGSQLVLDKPLETPCRAIWRGWMMRPVQYAEFFDRCRDLGAELLTYPDAYELMHCFPHSYHYIDEGDTPHIEVFETTIDAKRVNGTFDAFIVKDYVKSLKDTSFPARIETPITQERCDVLSRDFIELRGDLFTGGLVCKQFVKLKHYGRRTNEWRAFFFDGNLLDLSGNSLQFAFCPAPPAELVQRAAGFHSPFYTVDFAELDNGGWTILETGDGQVSGIASEAFAEEFVDKLIAALRGATCPFSAQQPHNSCR